MMMMTFEPCHELGLVGCGAYYGAELPFLLLRAKVDIKINRGRYQGS